MLEQLVHGLSFTNLTSDNFSEKSPIVRLLVDKYMKSKGGGEDEPLDDIMAIYSVAVDRPTFFILLIEKDDLGVGLMTAHALNSSNLKAGGMIHIGIVDESCTMAESDMIITEAMQRLDAWASDVGIPKLLAKTIRSEKPFDRLMFKHGWSRLTTIYEKGVSHGGNSRKGSGGSINGGPVRGIESDDGQRRT